MAVYRDIFSEVVSVLTAAQSGTLSYVKRIYEGNEDRDLTGSLPAIIVHPSQNQQEDWHALPNRRQARLKLDIRCAIGNKMKAALNPVRGALGLAEDVMNALEADLTLGGKVEFFNLAIEGFDNVGQETYAIVIGMETFKQFQKGAR